jgi:hypothetical protein
LWWGIFVVFIFRFLIVVAVAIQFLTLSATQAQAWEFNLSGSLMWTYEMYSQQGRAGFFGPYDVDVTASPYTYTQGSFTYTVNPSSAANLNLWNGINRAFNVQMASGTNVAVSYLRGDFWPTVKINPAIDIRGRFRVGSYGNNSVNQDRFVGPQAGTDAYQYRTWSNPGTLNNMGFYWPLLWGTARTPWGTVIYGKRPMVFGTGLQYDGDSNITSESILLKTYYGPISLSLGFYPYRQTPENVGYPYNSTNFHNQYYNSGDMSGVRKIDLCGSVIYSSGNLEVGVYEAYFTYHLGPESVLGSTLQENTAYFPRNTDISNGAIYTKYSNGRFFLNAEAAWLFDTTKFDGSHAPTYVEQWRYMAELGVISGPAKLGFLFASSPGLDRRHGAYIDKQPAGFLRQPQLTRELAGISLWRQYAYLMPYVYGSGLAGNRPEVRVVNSNGSTYSSTSIDYRANQGLNQEGSMLDALVLATRLDYAIASNLNVVGSFFWAERTSKSYPWGFISPTYPQYDSRYGPYYTGNVMFNFDANPASPAIPDTSLGYEIDLGLAWKLLENWKVEAMVCRWQPGKWFSYACVDKSVSAWRTPTSSNNFGTNPGRGIDAIMGVRVDVTSSF